MPYYKWKAIDWFGNIHYGKKFARSQKELSKYLLANEIGLIDAKQIIHKTFFQRINYSTIVSFFKELAILIDSGVLLPVALTVIKQQISNKQFQNIIEEIEFEINDGKNFADVISNYSYIFDPLMIQIVKAGQESDNLARSLILLSNYLEIKEKFKQRLRSALILPSITFCLFLFITTIIFLYIIPSFSSILTFSDQPIPLITKRLLNISNFLKNNGLILISILLLFVYLICIRLLKIKKYKVFLDRILLKVPLIGSISKYSNLTYFLQSLSLILNNGVHLSTALNISTSSLTNEFYKDNFNELFESINKGNSLSEAMLKNKNDIFYSNLIAMIKVGEETGRLDHLLEKASAYYFEKTEKLIGFLLTVLQPILLIILGIFISLLIFAVYIPMFNLPSIFS